LERWVSRRQKVHVRRRPRRFLPIDITLKGSARGSARAAPYIASPLIWQSRQSCQERRGSQPHGSTLWASMKGNRPRVVTRSKLGVRRWSPSDTLGSTGLDRACQVLWRRRRCFHSVGSTIGPHKCLTLPKPCEFGCNGTTAIDGTGIVWSGRRTTMGLLSKTLD